MRSFKTALLPSEDIPGTFFAPSHRWNFDENIILAEKNTQKIEIFGSRKATLYLNRDFDLAAEDKANILSILENNQKPDPEQRSIWLTLNHQIDAARGNFGLPTLSVQIKGVVFDEEKPFASYGGAGWPKETFFANPEGVIQRYLAPKEGGIGRCLLDEAVHEYIMCLRSSSILKPEKIYVPTPVGWGIFESASPSGKKFGFSILGLPDLVPGRESVYLSAAAKLGKNDDFTEMDRLLRLRSRAMRAVNDKGILFAYRHFGNISLTPSGEIFMHDLGTYNCLFEGDLYNRQQFAAEAFSQVAYAFTPRRVVIPTAPEGSPARRVAIDFLDEYAKSSIQGYYKDDPVAANIVFEDFEQTFFESLKKPLCEINLPVAQMHCNAFNLHHPGLNR